MERIEWQKPSNTTRNWSAYHMPDTTVNDLTLPQEILIIKSTGRKTDQSYQNRTPHLWYEQSNQCLDQTYTRVYIFTGMVSLEAILDMHFSNSLYELISWEPSVKVVFCGCHTKPLMASQHWFRYLFGAVRRQATTGSNVVQDLCRHILSLGHNELISPLRGIFNRQFPFMFERSYLKKSAWHLASNHWFEILANGKRAG